MQVFILVSDINDNAPIFQSSFNNLTLSESLPVSTAILNLVATDSDFGSNGLVSYSVLSERSEAGGIIAASKESVLFNMRCVHSFCKPWRSWDM